MIFYHCLHLLVTPIHFLNPCGNLFSFFLVLCDLLHFLSNFRNCCNFLSHTATEINIKAMFSIQRFCFLKWHMSGSERHCHLASSDPAPKDVSRHWETIANACMDSLWMLMLQPCHMATWKQAVKHAEQLQEHDTNQDRVVEMYVDSFIIHLSESSDDTSESD